MEKFRPTQELEIDVIKSLLGDISKLKYFIEMFDDGKSFLVQQINQELYLKLKNKYVEIIDQTIINIPDFFETAVKEFESEFPQYNIEIYEELYVKNFDFYTVISNYKTYIVRKEIIQYLDNLKTTFETNLDLNPTQIMNELNQIRLRFEFVINSTTRTV